MKKYVALFLLLSPFAHAVNYKRVPDLIVSGTQKIGASSAPAASSLLDVSSTTKGVIFPRMTATQRDAISSPATGLEIYNTTTNQKNVYTGAGWVAVGSGGSGLFDVNPNLLSNSGCEAGTTGWTASGGSLARNTTAANLGGGANGVCSWDASATSQTLSETAITITSTDKVSGRNGVFSCSLKTAATDLKLQVYDGTTVLTPNTATDVIPASTGYSRYTTHFVFPASGTATPRLASQSDSAIVYFKDCYFGLADGFNVFSESGMAATDWTAYTPVWGTNGLGTPTSVNFQYRRVGDSLSIRGFALSGTVSASAIAIPLPTNLAIDYASKSSTSANFVYGTASRLVNTGTIPSTPSGPWPVFSDGSTTGFLYLEAANTSTSAMVKQAGNTNLNSNDGFTIDVSGIPIVGWPTNLSGTALRPDESPAFWSGSHGGNCSYNTSSTSFVTPTDDGSCTFTQRQNINFGTVTTQGASKPGIVFTPSKPMRYKVCSTTAVLNDTSSGGVSAELYDFTDSLSLGQVSSGLTPTYSPISLCAIVNVPVGATSRTIGWRFKEVGGVGTAYLKGFDVAVSSVEWTIEAIGQLSAPLLVNSVISNATNVERVEHANFTNSGSCAINRQSGSWVSSPSDPGTGICTFNITGFSATPDCVCSAQNEEGVMCSVSASSTSSITTKVYSHAGSLVDYPFSIHCMGPR